MKLNVGGETWYLDFIHDLREKCTDCFLYPEHQKESVREYLKKYSADPTFRYLMDGPLWTGFSQCHPLDQFNRMTGRKVAFADAIKNFPRETRTKLWEAYHVALPNDTRVSL